MNRKRHIFPAFYFYPRPPRGGRRSRWSRGRGCRNFYPRPPRGGRRPELQCCCTKRRIFLSTPSARRATLCLVVTFHFRDISIHALREEGDLSPCAALLLRLEFLSTPSARRATFQHRYQERVTLISIHALREEGDALDYAAKIKHAQFLSTPSARRATSPSSSPMLATFQFLSTPSARRATVAVLKWDVKLKIFLSTPSARRATNYESTWRDGIFISIHALREEGDGHHCSLQGCL